MGFIVWCVRDCHPRNARPGIASKHGPWGIDYFHLWRCFSRCHICSTQSIENK